MSGCITISMSSSYTLFSKQKKSDLETFILIFCQLIHFRKLRNPCKFFPFKKIDFRIRLMVYFFKKKKLFNEDRIEFE